MARVEIQDLSKVFVGPDGGTVRAVRQVSLVVEDKELVVLVGPSGAGKSTLLRLIAGLEHPTEGAILLDGQIVNTVAPPDREVAMVFQNSALYPHFTVRQNLAFGLKLRKLPRPEIESRVRVAAEALDLTSCLDRKPDALSGGERQRVALGRALVRQPKVFLLDEPLSNLDARMREQLRAEILRLHRQLGATMIYVTHDQTEAMTMGDRIAVLREGAIHQVAEPLTLYRQPANLFVAGFIGSPPMNFFRGQLAGDGQEVWFDWAKPAEGGHGLRVPLRGEPAKNLSGWVGREVILGLRPEDVRCGADETDPTGVATLELAQTTGAETHLYVRAGGTAFVARVPSGPSWKTGQTVPFRFDTAKARWFDPVTEAALA